MVISKTVFDVDVFPAITATFRAVIDQSNSCMLIGRFGSIALVSYDLAICNTWSLFSSQGKAATLIR